MSPLSVAALLALVLSLGLLLGGLSSHRKRRRSRALVYLLLCVLFLALSALGGTVQVAMRGYRALTREEVAAVIKTRRTGPQLFTVRMKLADGRDTAFALAGDALYMDARIIKWRPIVNVLGLHTSYALDRVEGRYNELTDEQSRPRTVFAVGRRRFLDMFQVAHRFAWMNPMVDAEYGSASFIPVEDSAVVELRVSTTGLLFRPGESVDRPQPSGP